MAQMCLRQRFALRRQQFMLVMRLNRVCKTEGWLMGGRRPVPTCAAQTSTSARAAASGRLRSLRRGTAPQAAAATPALTALLWTLHTSRAPAPSSRRVTCCDFAAK